LTLPNFDVPPERTPPPPADPLTTPTGARSASENCARVKDLGFTASKHIKMYGEHFELVSDPFVEGDYTAPRGQSKRSHNTHTSASGIDSDRFGGSVPQTSEVDRAGDFVVSAEADA
jgi:hypothetical protein